LHHLFQLTQDYIENFATLMDFFEPKKPLVDSISRFYVPGDGWLTDSIEEILRYLLKRPFFLRFNRQQLHQFLRSMRPQTFKTDDLIFVESEVAVILQGVVHIKSH